MSIMATSSSATVLYGSKAADSCVKGVAAGGGQSSTIATSSRINRCNGPQSAAHSAVNTNNTNSSSNNNNNNAVVNMRVTANSIQGHRKYMEDCYKIRFQRETSTAAAQHSQQQLNKTANGGGTTATEPSTSSSSSSAAAAAAPDILFSYFAIFDGHGGKEAAQFCKDKLYWKIIEHDDFWSDSDSKVLNAIRNGFVKCHMDMWNELPGWPKTASGLPSTSGSTATVLFIKNSKAYVGHVGDSGLLIGYTKSPPSSSSSSSAAAAAAPSAPQQWFGKKLTRDHKPEDPIELKRIQNSGGAVMTKSGVNRVVWNRPVFGRSTAAACATSNGSSSSAAMLCEQRSLSSTSVTPYERNYLRMQRNVPTERVPFLAVARSLGDLWSYDQHHDEFIVSPVPDTFVFEIDPVVHKCLILATDGLWNVLKPSECVELVRLTDKETERLAATKSAASSSGASNSKSNVKENARSTAAAAAAGAVQPFINPSQRLVNTAFQRCCEKLIRSDNTTCITIMIDQPPDATQHEATGAVATNGSRRATANKNDALNALLQDKTFNDRSCRPTDSDLDLLDEDEDDEDDDDDDDDESPSSSGSENRPGNRTAVSCKDLRRCRSGRGASVDSFTTPSMKRTGRRRQRNAVADDNGGVTPAAADDYSNNNNNNNECGDEKRSRSLVSLRRRRWSASSNRSSSTATVTTTTNTIIATAAAAASSRRPSSSNNQHRFVNDDDRNRRRLFDDMCAQQQQQQQQTQRSLFSNKLNDDAGDSNNASGTISNQNNNNINHSRSVRAKAASKAASELSSQKRRKANAVLNASTVSNGLNRLSKSLRKSLNDLYATAGSGANGAGVHHARSRRAPTGDSNAAAAAASDEASANRTMGAGANEKENNVDEEEPTNNNNNNNNNNDSVHSTSNRYARRLKRLKNRLVQTKNSLWGNVKKKRFFGGGSGSNAASPTAFASSSSTAAAAVATVQEDSTTNSALNRSARMKSISSPHLMMARTSALLNRTSVITPRTKLSTNLSNIDLNESECELGGGGGGSGLGHHSFVRSVRSKLSYLKRNRSNKIIDTTASATSDGPSGGIKQQSASALSMELSLTSAGSIFATNLANSTTIHGDLAVVSAAAGGATNSASSGNNLVAHTNKRPKFY